MRGDLLDTHVWIWYLTGSSRLPPGVRDRIDAGASPPWLSPISVWELCMLATKGRIELDLEPRRWIERACAALPVREAPLNFEIALRSREIALPHPDPADAFLAATALVHDLTLLTVDGRLADLACLPTFSG